MTLDDIPANQTLTLTDVMDRLFKIAHCDPTCHCCHTVIKVGEIFELTCHKALVKAWTGKAKREEKDIMLCGKCSHALHTCRVYAIKEETLKLRRLAKWRRDNPRAGYTRLHLEK